MSTVQQQLLDAQTKLTEQANAFESSKQAWAADSARMCQLYDQRYKAATDSMADMKARFKKEMSCKESTLESLRKQGADAQKQVQYFDIACLLINAIQLPCSCVPSLRRCGLVSYLLDFVVYVIIS
jgi:hypothetical protein